MLCGCSCADPVVATCDDESACNYGDAGDCSYAAEGFDCAGNPLSACAEGQLEVVLTAMDEYGDGWNGNIANVYFDGVLFDPAGVGFTYSLADGSEEVVSFCIDQSSLATCLVIDVGYGSWQSEVSWTLADAATGGMAFYLEGGAPFYTEIGCPVPGCTDESAANYNPDATEDDGSCLSGCTDVAYTLGGGSYDGEMSFSINGSEYFSGDGSVCLEDGCFDVTLTDSYGDGWNGGTLTLGDDVFGLASGASGSGVFGVNADCNVYGCMDDTATNYNGDANTDDGSCEYDCATWLDTDELYACYWYVWEAGYGYTVEDMIGFGYDCTCVDEPLYGCTNATADNYNADADFDDGSCTYPPVACGDDQLEVVLTAMDSWGDGWNGNIANVYFDGVLFDPAGVGFTYSLAGGSEEVVSFCIDQSSLATCLVIDVGYGSYQGEVSWTLADAATGGMAFYLEGGAPFYTEIWMSSSWMY